MSIVSLLKMKFSLYTIALKDPNDPATVLAEALCAKILLEVLTMQKTKFYVMKDDLRVSDGFDSLEEAKAYAADLRDSQRVMLLASRKILKLFKKGCSP